MAANNQEIEVPFKAIVFCLFLMGIVGVARADMPLNVTHLCVDPAAKILRADYYSPFIVSEKSIEAVVKEPDRGRFVLLLSTEQEGGLATPQEGSLEISFGKFGAFMTPGNELRFLGMEEGQFDVKNVVEVSKIEVCK